MLKTIHFVYNGFSEYEVALACSVMARRGDLHTASLNAEMVLGEGGSTILPDFDIADVKATEYDLLIVSGMLDAEAYWEKDPLFAFIHSFEENKKTIASICGGPLFLAKAGVLQGKKYTCGIPEEDRIASGVFEDAEYLDEDVVSDKNLVTAKGYATIDFAIAVADKVGAFESASQREQFTSFWKNKSLF